MSTVQPPGAPHPMNGTMPAAMMQAPAVQQPAASQPHEALRFNRLESALTKLMEQVQVILENEERAQPTPAPPVIPATMVQRAGFWGATVPGFAQAPAAAVPQQAVELQAQPQLQPQPAPEAAMQPQAQPQPQPQGPPLQARQGLASRRGAEESLQIDTKTKTAAAKSPVQVLHESDTKKDGVESRRVTTETLQTRRQSKLNRSLSLQVEPVKKAAKDNDDPISPRSPGRFSAWK